MHIQRTRFGKDIVAEFTAPLKPSDKVIILADGMPSVPHKRAVLQQYAKRGYWVFHPRYRGSWESGGKFLRYSPHEDLLAVLDQLPKGFREVWSGRVHKVQPTTVYMMGSSFGGPALLLASRDPRVRKVVAFSPVVDWTVHRTRGETFELIERMTREGYGSAYRLAPGAWKKLATGKFYNPMVHTSEIDGSKILIFQAKDDTAVPWKPVQEFSRLVGADLRLQSSGEHLSSSLLTDPEYDRVVRKFLQST